MATTRIERDTFGSIEVPADRLWGAQTQRALKYFAISTEGMPLALLRALATIKLAAAMVNRDLALLDAAKADAIMSAAREVVNGALFEEFPLSVWQTGSGTQTHMNMNEVLANRASEVLGGVRGPLRLVHPNDDVNRSQSSNDVFPAAMHIAALTEISQRLLPALSALRTALADKSTAFAGIVKIGRTHLQDATPITLGQEFSGYVAQLDIAKAGIESSLPAMCQLALGGTAVGTGLNAPPDFGVRAAVELARLTGLPLLSARNKFAALGGHEPLVFCHGALKTLATALMKVANDVRWLASGPRSGLCEIRIPENEPGSSIMPGKVNPTQCEALTMICAQVFGNDVAINVAGASGNFELNVFKPIIIHDFLQSVRLLGDGMASFTEYCVVGIEPNLQKIRQLLEGSLMLVTALVPRIGYEKAAEIAGKAHTEGIDLKQAALALGYVTESEFNAWIRPEAMTNTDRNPDSVDR